SDGSFIYQPNSHYSGPDSFTYQVTNVTTEVVSNMTTVRITVTEVPPVALNQVVFGVIDQSLKGWWAIGSGSSQPVNADDTPLTPNLVSVPQHGHVTIASSGLWTFAPDSGFSGISDFLIDVSDGINTITETISVHIVSANLKATPISYATRHDTPLIVDS